LFPVDTKTESHPYVLALGVGAFTQGVLGALKADGARVATYLTRDYAHYGPKLVGPVFDQREHPNPCPLLAADRPDLVVPMSIEWCQRPWAKEFLDLKIPFLSPTGDALELERDRDFARQLCQRFGVVFPLSFVAANLAEAEALLRKHGRPFVLKNPVCGPNSPIHTIVCETVEDTLGWLPRLDYADGVFMQEYLGRAEAGHIALVSGGEVHSLVTNQEYKRAFDGDMGVVAGAPLGGLIERDSEDRYGLGLELIRPLLPWFREVNFHGPVQVTAIRHGGRWQVLEYNVRLGVTSGPMVCRMLENPLETLLACAKNEPLAPRWRDGLRYGCSVTLAGYGYPFTSLEGPRVPVIQCRAGFQPASDRQDACPTLVLWNEVALSATRQLEATGHRICDVTALAPTLEAAIANAYDEIGQLRCLGGYYRRDVGQSLWPPGVGAASDLRGSRGHEAPSERADQSELPYVGCYEGGIRAAWIEVDLGQLQQNFQAITAHAKRSNPSHPAQVLFVVKDDGFGHGAVEVSRVAVASGATHLAVVAVGEALELRRAGIDAPILVFGERTLDELADCVRHGLTVCVNELRIPQALSRLAGGLGLATKVHLKVNTGMNRYGVHWSKAAELAAAITRLPGIELEGVFSHFAMSDAEDKTFSMEQLSRFHEVLSDLDEIGIRPKLRHLCNSGGFLNFPEAHFDMVRLGLLPLGWFPSSSVPVLDGIRPVMTVKTRVAVIREVGPGDSVGYGRRFKAEERRRIAVLAIGYGDGYPRLVNVGCALIRGQRASVRGGVTMDAMMVDVTEVPGVAAGDEAVLMGRQGDELISAHELAGWANTVSYDVLVKWSHRMERRYAS
jgi:alanine racemase